MTVPLEDMRCVCAHKLGNHHYSAADWDAPAACKFCDCREFEPSGMERAKPGNVLRFPVREPQ